MIDYELIKQQLDTTGLFKAIHAATDPESVVESGIKVDAAYIIPMRESATSDQRTTGTYSQEITAQFGIMVAVRSRNDRLGKDVNQRLAVIVNGLRNALTGFTMPGKEPCVFIDGEIINISKQGAYWLDQYTINYLYENSGA